MGSDPWGNPIRYEIIDSTNYRLISNGPDKTAGTKWDLGLTVQVKKPTPPSSRPTWLDKRKAAFGIDDKNTTNETAYSAEPFLGGQSKLQGAAYFRFFTWLMLGATIVYLPFSYFYKPRTYLQD